jgi:hypothetical protein
VAVLGRPGGLDPSISKARLGSTHPSTASTQCTFTDPEAAASRHERCAGGIDIANAANISKMVLLAPDIVEAIVEGRTDDRVMLKVLEEALPQDWEEQRGVLGI